MVFDTMFFDDEIHIEIFHKKSTAFANKVGEADITMRELVTGYNYPVLIKNIEHKAGTLFFTNTYEPTDKILVDSVWPATLNVASQLSDKYEFFNDHLRNEFKDSCQFGYLKVDLDSLDIPLMSQNYKKSDGNSQLNAVFMIKIKIAAESNCIFVAAPNRILDVLHQSMTANIDSIHDKVNVEFYDIINETAFDARA